MKQIILIIILILTLSYLYSEEFSWPQYRHDAQRTGRSDMNEGPQKNPYIAWTYDGEIVYGCSDFVIGKDDNIFIAGMGGVVCIDKNGNEKWYNIEFGSPRSPMINNDGSKLWLSGSYYNLIILNTADGVILKSTECNGIQGFAEDKDGLVYLITYYSDTILHKFDKDGNEIWRQDVAAGWDLCHSISPEGDIFILNQSTISCFDSYGYRKWSNNSNSINIEYYKYPVIATDGTIYVMGTSQFPGLIAFNPDGTEKWAKELRGFSLGLSSSGKIYYSSEYHLYSINPDGSFKWIKPLKSSCEDIIIDSNNCIYLKDNTDLVCFNADGKELLRFPIDNDSELYALGNDKVLYTINRTDKCIYAIKELTGFSSSNSSSHLPSHSLSVSPNPFSTRLSVSLPSSGAIYSLTGQLIMNLSKGKHSLDTSSWREGVYIVKSGKECKRVVKVR